MTKFKQFFDRRILPVFEWLGDILFRGLSVIIPTLGGMVGYALGSAITALFVWPLWNVTVPDLFNLPFITFWNALALTLLVRLLFPYDPTTRTDHDEEK